MHHRSGELVRIMGIDDTPPPAEHDDTLLSPVLRPDVVGGLDQRLQKHAIRAALFGSAEAASVGRYRLLDRLGQGGMGRVYAAYDEQLDRKIAIKLIRASSLDSSEAVERTLREARALARVSHPNVVHVYEAGQIEGQLFVAMEFLAGPTLREWLDERRDRDWHEVLAVLRQAGEGLAAAHAQGIVHRDFKPHNLMFGADGRVRVLDFGLARVGVGEEPRRATSEAAKLLELPAASITATGALMGTPAYMAPEQLAGTPADVRSDVFGFCVTLFEALYGKRPFTGQNLDELRDAAARGRIEEPSAGTGVPPWLRKVVVRGLSADPAQRYASMPELLAALARNPVRRRKWWAAAALIGLVGAGGWGLAQVLEPDPADEQLRIAAERKALRSAELLGQGKSVDALALAIEAASMFDSPVVDEALFEATAADLSWGAIAQFPAFSNTLSFSPDGTRLAIAQNNTLMGIDYPAINVHRLDQGGSALELRTHGCLPSELEFGADGSTLMARCYESDEIRIWDANTGALIASFAGALSPKFSSSGLLVATREHHEVELTSATSGELVASLGHARAPTMIEFSADGSRLATGGADQDTRVWDTRSGALTTVLPGSSAVASSFFTDGADRIATVGADQRVRIWQVESGELLGVLSTPADRPAGFAAGEFSTPRPRLKVHDLDVSPDLTRIALYVDRSIWLWDTATGELVASVEDHAENPLGKDENSNPWVLHVSGPPLDFSPDGSRLVTRRHDGSIHLLDSRSGTTVARSNFAFAYSFSPDGESLAVGTGDSVEIWESSSGARIRSVPSFIPAVTTFSPDGGRIATLGKNSSDDPAITLWQIAPYPKTITEIVSRIDGRGIAAISADGARIITADDVVARVWDASSGAERLTLEGHRGPITSIATPTSLAAAYLATAGVEGTVLLWNLDSGQQHGLLAGHTDAVRLVELTADGTMLGSASDDHTVRLWDPESATALGGPLEHPGPVSTLRFSRDGTRLVTASGEIAYVWNVEDRAMLGQLTGHTDQVQSLAITGDGARIATHDGQRIRVWDSTTGDLIHELTDLGKIPTIEFSPDGERLASAGGVWDLRSGWLIAELEDHESGPRQSVVDPVVFSPDGALLALRGRVWNAYTGIEVGDFSTGHEEQVHTTGFLQAGARLLTVSSDAVVIRDAKPPLAAACERLRPFAVAYASVAAICDG